MACAVLIGAPWRAAACAVCFGAPDTPMTKGLNAGILFLLGLVILVLSGVAGFAVHLARRQSLLARPGSARRAGVAAANGGGHD
jgi:hypothetical protein